MSFFKKLTKPFKKLVDKSLDIGKEVFPGMLQIGGAITGGGWGKAASMLGSGIAQRQSAEDYNDYAQGLANQNTALQKEFAQHGVRWRVEDARAAGINPLAALGFQAPQYQSQVGDYTRPPEFSDFAAQMGQDITRAKLAKATTRERASAAAYDALRLRNLELQNQGLALENANALSRFVRMRELPPPMPGTVNDSGRVEFNPMPVTMSDPTNSAREPSSVTDYTYARTDSGGRVRIPSADVKNRIEDQLINEIGWSLRNQIVPMWSGGRPPSNRELKPMHQWQWNRWRQEWQQVPWGNATLSTRPQYKYRTGR